MQALSINEYENPAVYDQTIHSRWGKYTCEIEKDVILKADNLCHDKDSLLELGCGDGRWLKLLSEKGWRRICATEITENYLAALKRNIPNFSGILTTLDNTVIPCDNASQNLILTIEVEPIIHSTWFYKEAHRVLKSKGLIVGVLTNKISARGIIYKTAQKILKKRWFQLLSYNQSYNYWKHIIEEHGFHMIYEQGFCWFPFPRRSNSILIPFFINLEKQLGLRKLYAFSPWIIFIAQKNY